eukprot:CAMPEP_0197077494 /NCGR_PEP_ID=MMETSP1384-20130603/212649_1 /TAXON_ID=29189 /ORGANISM="Ammonia sp." /LENGTH=683 /DNA_ID=CAMNT_0042516359 /DNA_START=96 /DNA_END=2147 /DNA_ORIENTATION=-
MFEAICVFIKFSAEFTSNTAEMTHLFQTQSLSHECVFFVSKTSFVIWEWLMAYRCWMIYYDISWTSIVMADSWKSIINPKYIDLDNNQSDKFIVRHRSTAGNAKWMAKRCWMIYYDISWTSIVMADSWKSIINPKYIDGDDNQSGKFIVKYRSTAGNAKWMAKYVLSVVIFVNIVYELVPVLVALAHPKDFENIVNAQLSTLPLAVIPYLTMIGIYLFFRSTLFNDLLYIRSEMSTIFVFLACNITSFWSYFLYAVSSGQPNKHWQMVSRNLSLFFIFLIFSNSTFLVVRKFLHILKSENFSADLQSVSTPTGAPDLTAVHSRIQSEQQVAEAEKPEIKKLTLEQVFGDEKYFQLIQAELSTLPLAVIPYLSMIGIYLFFRSTLFNDLLYIRSEMTAIFVLLACNITSFWSYFIYVKASGQPNKGWQMASRNLSLFFIFLIFANSTFVVVRKFAYIMQRENSLSETERKTVDLTQVQSRIQTDTVLDKDKAEINKLTLNQVFGDEKYFQLFMQHLVLEVSGECMLSFVEMAQFQRYLYDNANQSTPTAPSTSTSPRTSTPQDLVLKADRSSSFLLRHAVQFCDYIPCSAIVESMHNGDGESQRKAAYELWKKYICEDCQLQINIPFYQREEFDLLMSDQHDWLENKVEYQGEKLAAMFDDCVNEVFMLMSGSFMRFKADLLHN